MDVLKGTILRISLASFDVASSMSTLIDMSELMFCWCRTGKGAIPTVVSPYSLPGHKECQHKRESQKSTAPFLDIKTVAKSGAIGVLEMPRNHTNIVKCGFRTLFEELQKYT